LARARKKLSDETAKVHFDMPGASQLMDKFKGESISDLISHLKEDIKKKF
jgi:hypothetical protein